MLTLIPFFFLADTYLICGNNPLTECMQQVNECLLVNTTQKGLDSDSAFEECSETVNPEVIND